MTAIGSSGSPAVFWVVVGVEVLVVMVASAFGWKWWQERDASAGHAGRSDLEPMGAKALVERGDVLRNDRSGHAVRLADTQLVEAVRRG